MSANKINRVVYPEFRFGKTGINDALRLVEMGVGGFCFYWGTAKEIKETTSLLKSRASRPLVFAADYENGLGQWMRDATLLPSNMAVGASASENIARRKAEITALEAKAVGVDWIFAPVVDLASNPENPIVNVRAFSDNPVMVSSLSRAYMEGLNSNNCLSCLKHFPGHGSTETDSHLSLPRISKSAAELSEVEMKPYRDLAGKADSVMVGHLQVDSLDPDFPASFSRKAIDGFLRREIGFGGCVVTDALSMGAVGDENEAGIRALLAGADILLVPKDPFSFLKALDSAYAYGRVSERMVEKALERQSKMTARISQSKMYSADFSAVGCPEHKKFPEEIASRCIAWAFKREEFKIEKGETIGYMEPLTPFEKIKGKAFVEELRKCGANVVSFGPGKRGKLIAGSFSNPRAYSGSINLSAEQKTHLLENMNLAESSVMISFGSPFVFGDFAGRISAGLCAFSEVEAFQKAAAKIIAGEEKASGKMPVRIK